MNFTQAFAYVVATFAVLATSAQAQNQLERSAVWPGYPGSILVAPQQANLLAPAIYRSVDDRDNLQNPVGVVQICERDMQLLRRRGTVSKPEPVAAAGVQNHSSRLFGGKLSLDAKVINASVGGDYDQVVTLNTGTVQVYETDDDDISQTVLRNVSRQCRRVIVSHLTLKRWVFVAAKAIQAYDYDAVVERVASGSASVDCGFFCRLVNGKAEVTAKITHNDRMSASKTFVTIALVPAEIEGRQSLDIADGQAVTPMAGDRRMARRARTAQRNVPTGTDDRSAWGIPFSHAAMIVGSKSDVISRPPRMVGLAGLTVR